LSLATASLVLFLVDLHLVLSLLIAVGMLLSPSSLRLLLADHEARSPLF